MLVTPNKLVETFQYMNHRKKLHVTMLIEHLTKEFIKIRVQEGSFVTEKEMLLKELCYTNRETLYLVYEGLGGTNTKQVSAVLEESVPFDTTYTEILLIISIMKQYYGVLASDLENEETDRTAKLLYLAECSYNVDCIDSILESLEVAKKEVM